MSNKKFDPANMTTEQKEFAQALGKYKTEEEAKEYLASQGVHLSEKDLEVLNSSGELDEASLENVSGGWAGIVIKYGIPLLSYIWKCNAYTNWGRNGRHCICGFHGF